MKRLMLFTLLLCTLALPVLAADYSWVRPAAQPGPKNMQIQLLTQERTVACQNLQAGEAFQYRNEAWLRTGEQVDYRMEAGPINRGSGQLQAHQNMAVPQEAKIAAVNLETGETIMLPHGTPVTPLSAELKLAPQGVATDAGAAVGAFTGPRRLG